jgi:hypothetical protein
VPTWTPASLALVGSLLVGSVASGVVVAGSILTASLQHDAERWLSHVIGLGILLIAIITFVAPLTGGASAIGPLQLLSAALALLALVAGCLGGWPAMWRAAPVLGRRNGRLGFLAAAGLTFLFSGGFFVFAGLVGERSGVTATELGGPLAISALLGVAGAFAAGATVGRIRPQPALALGVGITGTAYVAGIWLAGPVGLTVALSFAYFAYFFLFVTVTNLATEFDPQGSLAAKAQGCISLTYAGGVSIFAAMLDELTLSPTLVVALVTTGVGAAALAVLSRLRKG